MRRSLPFVCLLLVLALDAHGQGLNTVTLELAPPGNRAGNPVAFTFQGKIYDAGSRKTFDDLAKAPAGLLPEERFLLRVVDANKSGDVPAMLALWNAPEQGAVRARMSDKNLVDKNTAFFRNIRSSKFVGSIRYGQYALVYVEHDLQGVGPYMKTYALKMGDGGPAMTNELQDDFFSQKLADAIGSYLQTR